MRRSISGLALAVTVLALVGWGSGRAAGAGTGHTTPVVFVHGYNFIAPCPSANVEFTFGDARRALAALGRTGEMPAVGYYACDLNIAEADWINTHGPLMHAGPFGERGHQRGLLDNRLAHNADADLRHLAYHLAWYIWDRWSVEGQQVQLVGYSMGGLIVRWMMYRIAIGDPAYPPSLNVGAAVMVGTPFAGARPTALDGCDVVSFEALQCDQMRPGSELGQELAGWQGTAGATWSTISSTCDELVPAESAEAIAPARHYRFVAPCYMHGGPLGLLGNVELGRLTLLFERAAGEDVWRPSRPRRSLALLYELLP